MLVRDDILWRQYVSTDEAMKLYRKYIDIHIGKLEKIQYIFITATIVIDVVVSMWELSLVLHVCGTRARSLIAQRFFYNFSYPPPHSHAKSFCYVTEYTTGNNGSRCQFYLSPIVWSELCCEVCPLMLVKAWNTLQRCADVQSDSTTPYDYVAGYCDSIFPRALWQNSRNVYS